MKGKQYKNKEIVKKHFFSPPGVAYFSLETREKKTDGSKKISKYYHVAKTRIYPDLFHLRIKNLA
jgi:hypothetical protein